MQEQKLMQRLEGVSPAEMPEVLRLASELYAQDRAAIEQAQQQRELVRAAAEAGLPPEYLERAAATLQARRAAPPRPQRRRRIGPLVLLGLGAGLLFTRTLVRPPAVPPLPAEAATAVTFIGPSTEVDLSHHVTHQLSDSMLSTADNDLSSLTPDLLPAQKRERILNGIPFRLDGTILVGPGETTNGSDARIPVQPQVTGILVGRHVQRLHFLHGTHWHTRNGRIIGNYVLHYADGSSVVLPIRYGVDVVDWWAVHDNRSEAARHRVSWRGTNGATARANTHIRLFTKTWENPRPEVEIRSLDMTTGNQAPGEGAPAPFLVGLTVEEARPGAPDAELPAPEPLAPPAPPAPPLH
jgi:hypothetical protein